MPDPSHSEPKGELAPIGLQRAAAWSWRLLIVGAAIVVVSLLLWSLRGVAIPVFVALLIATQVAPLTYWLRQRGVPAGVAAGLGLLLTALVLVLAGSIVVGSVVSEAPELGESISAGVDDITSWLADNDGPLDLSGEKVAGETDQVESSLDSASESLFSGVLEGASLLVEVVGGLVLALTFLIYMLTDGAAVRRWIVGRFPKGSTRDAADRLMLRGWVTLGGFVRGTATVSFLVSVLIGIGLLLLGVPLAGALILLIFMFGFIPIAGAWISGIVAVLVAFADGGVGLGAAVAVLILGVQQFDSAFITPKVYKEQVSLNPMVTLGAVAAGGIAAGIIGAFLAVPVVAVVWATVSEYRKFKAGEPEDEALRSATPELGEASG